jgi:uncharacterized DUF497 family protein
MRISFIGAFGNNRAAGRERMISLMSGEYTQQQCSNIYVCLFMLVVAHTVREQDGIEVIRIIWARRATRRDKRRYEEENG